MSTPYPLRQTSGRPTAALLAHACVTISLLVGINSLSPSILTTLLGTPTAHTGAKTGTLLLVDELTALFVYPIAGWASDVKGVKSVACVGHVVAAAGLVIYVQSRSFGELVAARVFFAIGAGTLVTTLSSMLTAVAALKTVEVPPRPEATVNDEETALLSGSGETSGNTSKAHPGRLAGMVGFASGCGALLAVFVFLRLPNHLSLLFTERGENFDVDVLALQCTFYIIALVALGEALLLALLFPKRTRRTSVPPSSHLNQRAGSRIVRGVSGLFEGFRLASRSGEVALGYGTSFATRGQAVIVTTFVPLYINRYLTEHDLCDSARSLASNSCRRGFILSSILTGSIQLLALLLSPLLGYLSTCPTSFFFRLTRRNKSNPQAAVLALSFFFGALSFLGFAFLPNQGDPRAGVSWIYVVGLGIAQAAGVVLSLALVTSGSGAIAAEEGKEVGGALAGSYALSGGVGILVVGGSAGFLFDKSFAGAPFLLLTVVDGTVALGSAVLWWRS